MKIVFLGAFFNHHQKALSDALAARTDYTYIATSKISQMRIKLGYNADLAPEYVLEYDNAPEKAEQCLKNADVIITGSAPEVLVRQCIKRGQLVLRYAERPLKKGIQPLKYVPRLLKWNWQNPAGKPIYMLCASAYTAADYARFGLFRGKAFRWGYFPECRTYDSIEAVWKQKKKATILWVGRFMGLKHPDDAIRVAAKLQSDGYDFTLNMIGTGEMEDTLREMIAREGLEDRVHLLGTMNPAQVRQHMEESEIFLFTSDRQEGWGAVLNEAMNSGCAVIASHAAGAAPMLIKDGENGLIYRSGDSDGLYERVAMLLNSEEHRRKLGINAYETIAQQWNAEVAAQRFLVLAQRLLSSQKGTPYTDGPCSPAEIFREDWYKG